MWENETVVLVTSFKKRILGGKDRIRFGKISSDTGVPTFVKTLFKDRVEEFIANESPLSIQATPHFDLKSKDLTTLQTRFLDVLQEAASFEEKEVEEILREALVLRLDYLVKPVDTMRRMLFEKREEIGISEMEEVLDSFTKVLPYAEQVLGECRRLNKSSLGRDEYGSLMTDLLHRLMEEDSVKIVLRDFSLLTEFLSETKGEEITRVEVSVIQEFLVDRNLRGFRRALDVEMKLGKEDFDAVDLEVTLKRYLELKEEFSKTDSQEMEKFTGEEDSKKKVSLEEGQANEEKPFSKGEGWDLEDVLSEEVFPIEMVDEEEEKPAEAEPKTKPMRIIKREQEEEKGEAETLEPEKVSERDDTQVKREGLKNFIDSKTEKVFVKKLFGGDAAAYELLLGKLNEAESWRVAKILIDNELFKRDVDPFSREAIKLVDLAYNHYYPEEGVGGKK